MPPPLLTVVNYGCGCLCLGFTPPSSCGTPKSRAMVPLPAPPRRKVHSRCSIGVKGRREGCWLLPVYVLHSDPRCFLPELDLPGGQSCAWLSWAVRARVPHHPPRGPTNPCWHQAVRDGRGSDIRSVLGRSLEGASHRKFQRKVVHA